MIDGSCSVAVPAVRSFVQETAAAGHSFQHHSRAQLKAVPQDQTVCIGPILPHTIGPRVICTSNKVQISCLRSKKKRYPVVKAKYRRSFLSRSRTAAALCR